MKQISLLIKPASSLCNLRCTYCFYADVSENREEAVMGIMKKGTVEALIDQTMALPVSQINYCFQGGEPTLAGIDYFKTFIQLVNQKNKDKKITYSIQTNGTLLNDEWIDLFKEYHFLVGVSLDGFVQNHNRYRKNAQGKGTFDVIMKSIQKMEGLGIEYNILTVLTHELSKKPKQLLDFYLKNHLRYVQIIPCLPTLEGHPILDKHRLTPKDFASFYKVFFDGWYKEYMKGNFISVTLFDHVIPMYLGIPPQQCGMLGRCHMQLVVEGNGNIYPCDFFVLDKYYCGNIHTDSLESIMNHEAGKRFIQELRTYSNACEQCPFYKMCYGNCKRLAVCYYDKNYCGYQDFLMYARERMFEIAKRIAK